jgi:hypothetical protein
MPCFCISTKCAALSGVSTYLTAGAIPLREVRAPTSGATSGLRRVDGLLRHWVHVLRDRYWEGAGS